MKTIILIVLVLIGAWWALLSAVGHFERTECMQWQDQSAKYPLWFATQWQQDQCGQYDITFN